MKKINFNIIKEEDLEKQYGYTVVNAPEGKVGPGTCDDDDISDVEDESIFYYYDTNSESVQSLQPITTVQSVRSLTKSKLVLYFKNNFVTKSKIKLINFFLY